VLVIGLPRESLSALLRQSAWSLSHHSLPQDMPNYPIFKRHMDAMIDALEHFFMTAHNLLVATVPTRVCDPLTGLFTTKEDVKDAEDLVHCLTAVVETLAGGRDAVMKLLGVEEVDFRDIIANLSSDSSSNSDDASAPITVIDAVDTMEDNSTTVNVTEEDDNDGGLEGHPSLTLHDRANAPEVAVTLNAPEESNSDSAEMQALLDLFTATFGTDEGTMNRPIGSLINRINSDNTTTVDQSIVTEDEDTVEPENEHDPRTDPETDPDAED